ncbi:MAG: hypothetical protein AB7G93_07580 [Bdellovibrionales bacterium]
MSRKKEITTTCGILQQQSCLTPTNRTRHDELRGSFGGSASKEGRQLVMCTADELELRAQHVDLPFGP